jgi:quinol monooxygenase YgiN
LLLKNNNLEHTMPVGVIAKIKVKEGKNQEFEGLFKQLVKAVDENEPGNSFFELHKSRTDSQLYIVLEQYVDEDAFAAHDQTEHFKTIGAQLGPCMAAPPDIELMMTV